MKLLDCKNVTKSYSGERFKLNVESFVLKSNKFIGVIGPNGSGKSTFLKLIVNLIYLDNGSIRISGKKYNNKESRNQVAYLPEIFSFPANLTVYQSLFYFGLLEKSITPAKLKTNIDYTLQKLKVDYASKKVGNLSKGMNQTLAIAHILSLKKKVNILDEPFNGLDAVQKKRVIDILLEKKKDNISLLFTSHILSDVDKLCDEIFLLKDGQFVANKKKDLILKEYGSTENYYLNYFE